jgi:uncharacterized protein
LKSSIERVSVVESGRGFSLWWVDESAIPAEGIPVRRRREAEPSVPSARTLRIAGRATVALVADTHSRPHPRLIELLRARAPAAILHAGDIGDARVVDELGTVAPVHAVRGNIDAVDPRFPESLVLSIEREGEAALRVAMTHIAVAGPRLLPAARALARRCEARVLVCGHSHVPFATRDGSLVVFNPGSVGPRRFLLPIVFGELEVDEDGVVLRHVDCETGERWSPGALTEPRS